MPDISVLILASDMFVNINVITIKVHVNNVTPVILYRYCFHEDELCRDEDDL